MSICEVKGKYEDCGRVATHTVFAADGEFFAEVCSFCADGIRWHSTRRGFYHGFTVVPKEEVNE